LAYIIHTFLSQYFDIYEEMPRKYSKASQKKVEKAMHEYKHGTLKSGSGKKVQSKKQAIAIGLSEARREGKKAPPPPSRSRRKKDTK
jgi:hypothetical protein